MCGVLSRKVLSLLPVGLLPPQSILWSSDSSDCSLVFLSLKVEDRDYLERWVDHSKCIKWFQIICSICFSICILSLFLGISISFCLNCNNAHILGWDVLPKGKWRDVLNCRRWDVLTRNQGNAEEMRGRKRREKLPVLPHETLIKKKWYEH